MRNMFLCGAIPLTAMILFALPSEVDAAGWCLESSGRAGEGTLCRFRTFEQCMESARGTRGTCIKDLTSEPAPARTAPKRATQSKKPAPAAASKPQPKPAAAPEQKQAAPAQTPATQAAASQGPADKLSAARDLVLGGQYEAGLKALLALGNDQNPDVATYIGLAHVNLGRADEGRAWLEKALAADPRHLQALSYYGMLRVQQGDIAGAKGDLETIRRLCGSTSCDEYVALAGALANSPR